MGILGTLNGVLKLNPDFIIFWDKEDYLKHS